MITLYVSTLPPNFGGIAYGPVVLILEKYRHDAGLHAHERFHVKQWWVGVLLGALASLVLYPSPYWYYPLILGVGLHAILYLLSDRHKLWKEVQAYKEQAKHYPDDRLPLFADYIAYNYGLRITPEQAYAALTKD